MIVGFTGTRRGMTHQQEIVVRRILTAIQPSEFHHGDCVGADSQAHGIARELRIGIFIHPPVDKHLRAFCRDATMFPELPYLERNRLIVDLSEMIIATPRSSKPERRSGTWATIRYAKVKLASVMVWTNYAPVTVVSPDGFLL